MTLYTDSIQYKKVILQYKMSTIVKMLSYL